MTREQALKALELHDGASCQEIKQAYRDLASVWHPDRFAHSTRLQDKASARLKEINAAYDVLRSYDYEPSRAHEPRTKHTGSKHSASVTEQSGTQRQRSRKKNRSATSSAQHSESHNSKKQEQSAHRPSPLAWVGFAGLLFLPVIAGLLNERTVPDRQLAAHQAETVRPSVPIGATAETTTLAGSESDPTDEELIDPLDSQGGSSATPMSEPRTGSPEPTDVGDSIVSSMGGLAVREDEEPIDPLDSQRGSSATPMSEPRTGSPEPTDLLSIDTDSSSRVDLGTDSTNPVLAVREPDAGTSGASSLYFTRGSHRDDVLRIQGTPSSINRYSDYESWKYGYSRVDISLRDGRVTEWNDISGNLKVSMKPGSNVTGNSTFTRGSHRDDVLRIQGTPSSINRYSDHESWRYGYSRVDISLRDGRVTEWNDISGNLKVSMKPGSNVTGNSTFTRGSHRDDVLRIQGTPSSINRYSDHESWRYGYSRVDISLRDGRVTEWNNISGNLKVSMDQQ